MSSCHTVVREKLEDPGEKIECILGTQIRLKKYWLRQSFPMDSLPICIQYIW